jgi:pimeloyl-ACP methyl ester carboxylesterase
MKEMAIMFGRSRSLTGIFNEATEKHPSRQLPAFIFLNSGVIHRIGPNRLHVRMAREMASMGFPSLRFDMSGIGDSRASRTDIPRHERWAIETQEAMNFLNQEFRINRFILIGNCSGAGAAFLTANVDARVTAAVLINPQGPKKLLRYYMRLALFNLNFWLRVIRGRTKFRREIYQIREQSRDLYQRELNDVNIANEAATKLHSLIRRGTDILIVHCEWDPGWDYFKVKLGKIINELSSSKKIKTEIIYGINHDFNMIQGQEDLIRIVRDWASQII